MSKGEWPSVSLMTCWHQNLIGVGSSGGIIVIVFTARGCSESITYLDLINSIVFAFRLIFFFYFLILWRPAFVRELALIATSISRITLLVATTTTTWYSVKCKLLTLDASILNTFSDEQCFECDTIFLGISSCCLGFIWSFAKSCRRRARFVLLRISRTRPQKAVVVRNKHPFQVWSCFGDKTSDDTTSRTVAGSWKWIPATCSAASCCGCAASSSIHDDERAK